jgi:hypothetical protein
MATYVKLTVWINTDRVGVGRRVHAFDLAGTALDGRDPAELTSLEVQSAGGADPAMLADASADGYAEAVRRAHTRDAR